MTFFIGTASFLTPIGVYLYHKVDPTFDFLFPIHVIGISKDSPYYYAINFWTQAFCLALCYSYVYIDFLIFLTITSHILVELNGINEMCKNLGKYEEISSSENIRVPKVELGNNKNVHAKTLLKQIHERHVKILELINITSNFYLINMLLNEAFIVAIIGFVFYVLTFIDGNYYLACSMMLLAPQFLVVSYIGSRILEAGSDTARTLYDANWLYLNPKDRKVLCAVMAMAQKPHTLSAGGFADVSLSRFAVVMNGFLSNLSKTNFFSHTGYGVFLSLLSFNLIFGQES